MYIIFNASFIKRVTKRKYIFRSYVRELVENFISYQCQFYFNQVEDFSCNFVFLILIFFFGERSCEEGKSVPLQSLPEHDYDAPRVHLPDHPITSQGITISILPTVLPCGSTLLQQLTFYGLIVKRTSFFLLFL